LLPIEPFNFGLDGLGGAAGEGERSIGETKRCAGEGEGDRSIGETNCFAGEGDRNIGETKRFTGGAGDAGAGDAGEWVLLGTISSIIYMGRPSGVKEPAF
jgi:hypothetical protein